MQEVARIEHSSIHLSIQRVIESRHSPSKSAAVRVFCRPAAVRAFQTNQLQHRMRSVSFPAPVFFAGDRNFGSFGRERGDFAGRLASEVHLHHFASLSEQQTFVPAFRADVVALNSPALLNRFLSHAALICISRAASAVRRANACVRFECPPAVQRRTGYDRLPPPTTLQPAAPFFGASRALFKRGGSPYETQSETIRRSRRFRAGHRFLSRCAAE